MRRTETPCSDGHELRRVDDPEHGERIVCRCGDLDVPRPAGHPPLSRAYRTWDSQQGHLEGADRGTE